MGHLAKADGRVSEQELNMARLFMDEMRLSSEQKTLAKHFFNEGKQPQFNLDSALENLKKICEDNRDLLRLFIDIQYRAAQADGLDTKKSKYWIKSFPSWISHHFTNNIAFMKILAQITHQNHKMMPSNNQNNPIRPLTRIHPIVDTIINPQKQTWTMLMRFWK